MLPVLPVTQPPPRCSRSGSPSLLIARADPDLENLRGACWLQSRVETAGRTCLWAACCHSAACCWSSVRCALLVAVCARVLLQQPHPCSGSVQSSMPSGDASDRCHTRAMAGGVLCAWRCGSAGRPRAWLTTRACVGRAGGQSLWNETGQTAVKSSSMLPLGQSGPSDSHHKALLVCFNLAFLLPV